jgi:hypothetical protein
MREWRESGVEVLVQRVPITDGPALVQASPFIFGKARVIEDDADAGSARVTDSNFATE